MFFFYYYLYIINIRARIETQNDKGKSPNRNYIEGNLSGKSLLQPPTRPIPSPNPSFRRPQTTSVSIHIFRWWKFVYDIEIEKDDHIPFYFYYDNIELIYVRIRGR